MAETGKIRILIADDFKFLRDVIRLYLARAADMDVADEAVNLDDALERSSIVHPDIIIMNGDLPPTDSADASSRFREQGFPAAILVISMHLEPGSIRRSFRGGANGFMHKEEIDEYLVDAVRSIHRGERYLSPRAREAYGGLQE